MTGNTVDGLDNDQLVEIWLRHNELRWKVVLSSPVFSATIIIGWFALEAQELFTLADYILVLGLTGMISYFILIKRLSDYAGAYYDAINGKPNIREAALGVSANKMSLSIPVLLATVFVALLFIDTSEFASSRQHQQTDVP